VNGTAGEPVLVRFWTDRTGLKQQAGCGASRLLLLAAFFPVIFSLQHYISWYHKKLCIENLMPVRILLRPFASSIRARSLGGDIPKN
jgi:hypothetical protein